MKELQETKQNESFIISFKTHTKKKTMTKICGQNLIKLVDKEKEKK